MTEQCVEQQTSQEDIRTSSRGAAKHEDRDYHSEVEDVMEERQMISRMVGESLQDADQEQQEPADRTKPSSVRSKTLDNSMSTQVQIDPDSKSEGKKSHYNQLSKSNCQYHKIFKEISKEEQLRQSYTCASQKDILYQGRMFVSDHWICFHSKVFGKDTKIAIPVMSVTNIKKTKTAISSPNASVIATTSDRYVFVSFSSRDNTYKFLTSVCLHLESPCSSPLPSSGHHSFRGQRSPSLTRFPMSDFVDSDGAMRKRREEMEENSSSDSQAPDYDKIADSPIPHFSDASKQKGNTSSPEQKHKVKKQHSNQQSSNKRQQKRPSSEGVIDSRAMKAVSLNTSSVIYMFSVCVSILSSCYSAFRIVSLEQRSTTLSSISDFTHHESGFLSGSADVNTESFSESSTINSSKSEKVQQSLQRLSEEAV